MRKLFFNIIFLAGLFSCKEPFPPYVEPKNVLEATLVRTSPDTLYVAQDSAGVILGSENIKIQVHVANIYPQLLQGVALIKGRIDYFVTSPIPRVGRSQTITRNNILRPPVVQNTIAVPPGQYAELHCDLPLLIGGNEVYTGIPYSEQLLPDSTRIQTFAPMTIQVRGTVQIFERVQVIEITPLTFQQTVVKLIIRPKE